MIYFKHILFLLFFTFFFSFQKNDSLLISKDNIDKKAILIPKYNDHSSDFEVEYLGKNRKIFYHSKISYLSENKAIKLSFSPLFNYKNFKFKIDLDYFFNLQDSTLLTNDWTPIGIIEKIDYFELKLFKNQINFFLGEISNLSFGYGYLLNNYANSHNYPLDKNVGFKLSIQNFNSSVLYQLFISNLDELSNSGGLIGNHFSVLISDNLPLRLGLGYIVDLDQFVDYKDYITYSRKIDAIEFDFDIPLFNIANRNVLLFGELSTIKFPETRYYKRVDDNRFTNDKKFRDGVWGLLFPGFKYSINNYTIILGLNYNSSIFLPHYFNTTYDFEKIRYRLYDIISNEENFSDESELLMNFSSDDSNQSVFIPKDLYSMINGYENTYPTFGYHFNLERKINDNHYFNIEYSYFKELNKNNQSLSFNDLLIDFSINKDLFSINSNLNLFFSKSFFSNSNFSSLDENLIYGFKIKLNIYKNLYIISDFKNIFYDNNFDGEVDKISYINMGFKIKL